MVLHAADIRLAIAAGDPWRGVLVRTGVFRGAANDAEHPAHIVADNVGDAVVMLADGNADYAKALGLELDATGFGMGVRGKRFSVVVKDGVVTHLNLEGPGEFKVSSAEHVLTQL